MLEKVFECLRDPRATNQLMLDVVLHCSSIAKLTRATMFYLKQIAILDWPVRNECIQDYTHVDHNQFDDPLPFKIYAH